MIKDLRENRYRQQKGKSNRFQGKKVRNKNTGLSRI